MLASYNADVRGLFTRKGRDYLAQITLSDADRFQADLLAEELDQHTDRLKRIDQKLREFAARATLAEREARALLATAPGVGPVTTDVVLAELGDARRFRSQRKATAFAGLAPGIRQSAGRAKQLGITKEGSRLLRWVLVQAAWRAARHTARWRAVPTTGATLRGQEGNHRRRPPAVVRARGHAPHRPTVPPRATDLILAHLIHGVRYQPQSLFPRTRRRPRFLACLVVLLAPTGVRVNGGVFVLLLHGAFLRKVDRIDG